jgi:hypothetical protein
MLGTPGGARGGFSELTTHCFTTIRHNTSFHIQTTKPSEARDTAIPSKIRGMISIRQGQSKNFPSCCWLSHMAV